MNGMLGILAFVKNVDEAAMKLSITKEVVSEIFRLIQEVSDLAVNVAMAGSWKGDSSIAVTSAVFSEYFRAPSVRGQEDPKYTASVFNSSSNPRRSSRNFLDNCAPFFRSYFHRRAGHGRKTIHGLDAHTNQHAGGS